MLGLRVYELYILIVNNVWEISCTLTEDISQVATWEHDTSTNPQSVVQSHSLTPVPSLLLTLAPFSTRNFTVFTWPLSAAQCRGDI